MASPQKENGYTPIANEIIEAVVRTRLTGSQLAMLLVIMRKTYGFKKKEDAISISKFMEMIGISRRAVVYNLKDLEARSIIFIKRSRNGELNDVNVVRLNKDYDAWVVQGDSLGVVQSHSLGGVVQNSVRGSAKQRQRVVNRIAPTKENIQKKYIQKKSSRTSVLHGEEWNQLIDSFEPINPLYADLYRNTTERNALEALAGKWGFEKLLNTIRALPEIVAQPYAPKITKPTELRRDIGKLLLFLKQEESKQLSKGPNVLKI